MSKTPLGVQVRTANDWFGRFAAKSPGWLGSKWALWAVVLLGVIWAARCPLFHYSAEWQLVMYTGASIITFLMVFLIQNTQNRTAKTRAAQPAYRA